MADSRPFHAAGIGADAGSSGGGERTANAPPRLGLRGVEIPPKVIERQLDESEFEVFWEAAEALRMVVCIHPFEAAPSGALARYFLGNLVGNLYDTGLAAALLIYGGVLERHPNFELFSIMPAARCRRWSAGSIWDIGWCLNAARRFPGRHRLIYRNSISTSLPTIVKCSVTWLEPMVPERFVDRLRLSVPAGLDASGAEVKALGSKRRRRKDTRRQCPETSRARLIRVGTGPGPAGARGRLYVESRCAR